MISAAQWEAYNGAVESIRSKASSAVEREVLEWCAAHEGASVEDAREAGKAILSRFVKTYDQDAAVLAAEWYDAQGRAAGAKLDRAVTAVTYTNHDADKLARYQAEKYKNGDVAGFAAMCAEYAANDAMKSVNATILKNAKRDKKKGVKFARVTSGLNTCAFCLMLAGRGAVYHTRKSAGEFDHWHRHCTCKVVPCFSGDRYEVLVEGHNPLDAKRWSDRVQDAKSARRSIPGYTSCAPDECDALQKELDDAWKAYRSNGGTADSYREHYAALVKSKAAHGAVEIEDFTVLEGKELQEALWLANSGHTVLLRNPDGHKERDGNTSDALVDGVLCDFKKPESPKLKKMVKLVTSKLGRQGPAFLVDLTGCDISLDSAEVRCAELLDDDLIEAIYIVRGGIIECLRK